MSTLEHPAGDTRGRHDGSVNRTSELPSERVNRELRELVAALEHGQQLPAVRELAGRYGTSPETVRRVLAALEAEGLVVIRARWGTFRA